MEEYTKIELHQCKIKKKTLKTNNKIVILMLILMFLGNLIKFKQLGRNCYEKIY